MPALVTAAPVAAVRLRFCRTPGADHYIVEARDNESGEIVAKDRIGALKSWLDAGGYSYVEGTRAIWARS